MIEECTKEKGSLVAASAYVPIPPQPIRDLHLTGEQCASGQPGYDL